LSICSSSSITAGLHSSLKEFTLTLFFVVSPLVQVSAPAAPPPLRRARVRPHMAATSIAKTSAAVTGQPTHSTLGELACTHTALHAMLGLHVDSAVCTQERRPTWVCASVVVGEAVHCSLVRKGTHNNRVRRARVRMGVAALVVRASLLRMLSRTRCRTSRCPPRNRRVASPCSTCCIGWRMIVSSADHDDTITHSPCDSTKRRPLQLQPHLPTLSRRPLTSRPLPPPPHPYRPPLTRPRCEVFSLCLPPTPRARTCK
jgi:hypothetical protein